VKHSKRRILLVVVILVVVAGGTVGYYFLSDRDGFEVRQKTSPDNRSERYEKKITHLYFSDSEERFLKAEERILPVYDTMSENARAAVEALISGPNGKLSRTIPEGTVLLSIYLTPDRTAYVDFDETITEKHPGGAGSELLTVFSIVNTLTLNFPEIDKVKILIRGREHKTLAGHVFLQQSFDANLLLIR
jgi:spore germination protein GerM